MNSGASRGSAVREFCAAQAALSDVGDRLHAGLLQELSALTMAVDLVVHEGRHGETGPSHSSPSDSSLGQLVYVLEVAVRTAQRLYRDVQPRLEHPRDFTQALREVAQTRGSQPIELRLTTPPPEDTSPTVLLLGLRALQSMVDAATDQGARIEMVAFSGADMRMTASCTATVDLAAPSVRLVAAATRELGGTFEIIDSSDGSAGPSNVGSSGGAKTIAWHCPPDQGPERMRSDPYAGPDTDP